MSFFRSSAPLISLFVSHRFEVIRCVFVKNSVNSINSLYTMWFPYIDIFVSPSFFSSLSISLSLSRLLSHSFSPVLHLCFCLCTRLCCSDRSDHVFRFCLDQTDFSYRVLFLFLFSFSTFFPHSIYFDCLF